MNTVTTADIRSHVIDPACAADFDEATLQAITDAVLAAAPLSTWRLDGLEYKSDRIDTAEFWQIVEKTTTR